MRTMKRMGHAGDWPSPGPEGTGRDNVEQLLRLRLWDLERGIQGLLEAKSSTSGETKNQIFCSSVKQASACPWTLSSLLYTAGVEIPALAVIS